MLRSPKQSVFVGYLSEREPYLVISELREAWRWKNERLVIVERVEGTLTSAHGDGRVFSRSTVST